MDRMTDVLALQELPNEQGAYQSGEEAGGLEVQRSSASLLLCDDDLPTLIS